MILLTPLLLLGVLLLLGFAGCQTILGIEDPVLSPSAVEFELRVPETLAVTEILFRAVNPNGVVNTITVTNPAPSRADVDGVDVFRYTDGEPVPGGWSLSCTVSVNEDGTTAQDDAQADVIIEEVSAQANFRTTGSPSTGDFFVAFTGLE